MLRLSSELAARLRRLEIRTRQAVEELLGGAYRSVFRGQGIEFDTVRPYLESDDVRSIDWNVTARMGCPYVKTFIEERELSVMLACDLSASCRFGSGTPSKMESIAQLAALLALAAGRAGDKVGLLTFGNGSENYLPPRSGRRHYLRLAGEILTAAPAVKPQVTDLDAVLRRLGGHLIKRSVVFLLTDLISSTDFSKNLRMLGSRHDVIVLELFDHGERESATDLVAALEDAETGEIIEVKLAKASVQERLDRLNDEKRRICRDCAVDLIEINASGDLVTPLLDFFASRRRRAR